MSTPISTDTFILGYDSLYFLRDSDLMIDVVLSAMSIAIACFSLSILSLKISGQYSLLFMLTLGCCALLATGPITFAFWMPGIQWYVGMLPVAFFILLPSIYLYHEALISDSSWRLRRSHFSYFAGALIFLPLTIAIWVLPKKQFERLFFSDVTTNAASSTLMMESIALAFFVAFCVWCLLSIFVVLRIYQRTMRYRQRLKQFFADETGKTLNWFLSVTALIVVMWLYSLVVLLFDEGLSPYGFQATGIHLLLLAFVWIISANGLVQKAVMVEVDTTQLEVEAVESQTKPQYERSALNQRHLSVIAGKLEKAIREEQMHLEADLNLTKLAKHVGEPAHYVSQTLSQQLDTTFFDFVNQARVEAAKAMLQESQSSVLDIALATGFNARSSFYKAFKHFTEMTPSQYRKQIS